MDLLDRVRYVGLVLMLSICVIGLSLTQVGEAWEYSPGVGTKIHWLTLIVALLFIIELGLATIDRNGFLALSPGWKALYVTMALLPILIIAFSQTQVLIQLRAIQPTLSAIAKNSPYFAIPLSIVGGIVLTYVRHNAQK